MKYMQNGGFQNNPLMRLTVGLTLFLILGLWITNFAMYFQRMDMTPGSVVTYYNGSEEEFRPPRSAAAMLETTHMHLPMMGMVLLFLTHLLIFVPIARPAKVGLICAAFTGALFEEAAGWLVRFVDPGFAPVKIVGFVLLQATLGFVMVALAAFLVRAALRAAAPDEEEDEQEEAGLPRETARGIT